MPMAISPTRVFGVLLVATLSTQVACERPTHGQPPAPEKDLARTSETELRYAVLAGGCFWCTEGVFQMLDGVVSVESGYAGGTAETANYRMVASGQTAHAEAIRIRYDARRLSYGQLLQVFFATHDPTTLNRQGPDVGPQYRSAIFFANDQEKQVAAAYIAQLNEAKAFGKPVVTTLEPLVEFFVAEGYHQDFVEKNPDHPYIRQQAIPKMQKTEKFFPELLRGAAGNEAGAASTQPGR